MIIRSIGIAAAFLAFTVSAQAQDFSGRFWGVSLGYVGGDNNHNWAGNPAGQDVDVSGAALAFSYGNNWQNQTTVFGYEARLGLSNADGFELGAATPCITPGEACNNELNAFATFNGRVGFVTAGGYMPYFTAGLAAGDVAASGDTGACGGAPCTLDEVRFGFNFGVGVEWMMPSGWHLQAEYRRLDFGDEVLDGSTPANNVRAEFQYDIVSIGMVRRF